jgi:transcriptional regulator with XRE-family HTH domain
LYDINGIMKDQTKKMMRALASVARAQGTTQEKLADELAVSIPTLKRWLAGVGVSVDHMFRIMEHLGVALEDVASDVDGETQKVPYTIEQEDYFIDHLSHLVYFEKLVQGLTPKAMQRKYRLNYRSTRRYLAPLEMLGLLEILPHDRIRLLVSGIPVLRSNGTLRLILHRASVEEFLARQYERSEGRKVSMTIHPFTLDDKAAIQLKITELTSYVRAATRRARRIAPHAKEYGLLVALAPFSADDVHEIRNL